MKMDKVCRICLRKGNQHEEIENSMKDLLDALLILDSLDTKGPQISIVCKECVAQIHELFDFKTLCLHTEYALFPFIEENDSKMAQLDLRSVYSEIKLRQYSELKEEAEICRLCLEITTQWVSLETAISQTSVREVFKNNMPEIALQTIMNPCICENCINMLDNLYSFASQCKSSTNIMKTNGAVKILSVETSTDDTKIKVENQFDKECKIEMNENPIDYVEYDVERSLQRTPNSDRYIKKEEEEEDSDLSSATNESNFRIITLQDRLENQCPLEDSMKPIPCDSCLNLYNSHVDLALHSINHSDNSTYSCHVCKNYANAEKNLMVMHINAHEGKEIVVNCDYGSDVDSSLIKEHLSISTSQTFGIEPMLIEHYKQEHGHEFSTESSLNLNIPIPMEEKHCGKGFSQKSHLNDHSHTGEKPHICSHCGIRFSRVSSLNVHLRTHMGKKPYICAHCGKGFSLKTNLNTHSRTHTGEKPFICLHCGKGFSRKTHLNIHSRTHTGEKPHICSHCGKGFSLRTHLTTHLRTHTGEKPHICSYCGKGFSQKAHLTIHLRTHTGEKPHFCSLCEKGFSRKTHLNIHSRTHTGEKPYICSHCEKGFSVKSHMNEHLYTHTGKKPYICSHCGKGFSLKSHFNDHLHTHTGEKPYICDHCGMQFFGRSNLNYHLLTHKKEKPHICSQCGKGYSQKSHLNDHLHIHTGEKPFVCSHCGKGFTRKEHLNCHMRTHTGEKPYICAHCGKGFTKKTNLDSHSNTHTDEKLHISFHCGEGFSQKENLITPVLI